MLRGGLPGTARQWYYVFMLGSELKQIRNELGLTQNQLAAKLELSEKRGRKTVGEWENDVNPIPAWVADFVTDGLKADALNDISVLVKAIKTGDTKTLQAEKRANLGIWPRRLMVATDLAFNLT